MVMLLGGGSEVMLRAKDSNKHVTLGLLSVLSLILKLEKVSFCPLHQPS